MRRLVTVSYTDLNAGGGVPKFNRDLHDAFPYPEWEHAHFCWDHFPWKREVDSRGETEWGRARMLNEHLVRTRLVTPDDIVVTDGFWAAGLEHLPLVVSHSHGIWSHLTHEDVLAGKQPDMPEHHAAQVAFRQRWHRMGKPMTAVSAFIANELKRQWDITVDRVINNGVDTDFYRPAEYRSTFKNRKLIIHGVNDPSNANKGWDHIQLLKGHVDADVMSLDEAYGRFQFYSDWPWTKASVLSQADLFVHPSGYEGNSMICCEALACGVPFVGYNVGLMWQLQQQLSFSMRIGAIMDRSLRSPKQTLHRVQNVMDAMANIESEAVWLEKNARQAALDHCSLEQFRLEWRYYVSLLEERANA